MYNNVIYIAGPMRGRADLGRNLFNQAEEFLKGRFGYEVLNPAVLPIGLPEKSYMPICIAMLEQADAIGLLPGWEDSDGARLEKAFAEETRKKIIILEDEYGFEEEQEANQ